jgi:hypothetical protein
MIYVNISYCKLIIFADDLVIFHVINSSHNCLLLQSDINSMSNWCFASSMKLIIAKMHGLSYTMKIHFLVIIISVRFEVFTAATMRNGVFWDVTPCGSCKNRRLGGA